MRMALHVGAAMVPKLLRSNAAIPVMRYCSLQETLTQLQCDCAQLLKSVISDASEVSQLLLLAT